MTVAVAPPWSGRRVLVTGGHGFIGARLCRGLVGRGAEVHTLSRGARDGDGVRGWRADLRDAEAVARVVREVRPARIFHLGGHVSARPGVDHLMATFATNLGGSVHVLAAAQAVGCERVVLTGSVLEPEGDEPARSPYALAKAATTRYARLCRDLYGLETVVLRPFTVYGPSPQDPAKLIPHVVASLLRGVSPEVGPADRAVDWVYLDDVVDAHLRAADAADVAGEALDVGTGRLTPLSAIVARIAARLGVPAVARHDPERPDRPTPATRRADTERTAARLGWRATTDLDDGMRATVDFHRDAAQERR